MKITLSLCVGIAIGILLSVVFLSSRSGGTNLDVALEPLLPPQKKIANRVPTHISFTLVGSKDAVDRQVSKVKSSIRPDLRQTANQTVSFYVTQDFLGQLEPGVQVTKITPSQITIEMTDR